MESQEEQFWKKCINGGANVLSNHSRSEVSEILYVEDVADPYLSGPRFYHWNIKRFLWFVLSWCLLFFIFIFFYILLTCMFDGFDLFSTLQCHFIWLSFLKVHFREVRLKLMGLYLVPGAKQVSFPVSDQEMGEMGEMLHVRIQWAAKPRILAYAPGKRLDWVGTIFASGIYLAVAK